MKKISIFFLFIALSVTAFSQTADEVINKFIQASGGKEKLKSINSLQYTQEITIASPMGEFKIPVHFYKQNNKLFRMQASMQFGPQALQFFTVVTDTSGYIMLPELPMLGSDGGLKKLSAEERDLQKDQLDAAGFFAALVDYAAKGNKAELLQDEKVNNEDCYKVKFSAAAGGDMTYYFSKATNMIVRTDVKGAASNIFGGLMGAMPAQNQNVEVTTLFNAYTDVNGIKFPLKFTIKNQMGDAESVISNVKVNQPIDAKLFRAEM